MTKSNQKKLYRIGFDLGGTKMMAAVLDGQYNIVSKAKKKTKGYKGAEDGVARILATLDMAMDEAAVSKSQLLGIGVAAPAPLDLNKGMLCNPTNMKWGNVPLKDILEKHFQCPVILANDVDAGTYGEYCFGAGKNAHCLLGVFPGTGIGGGCVYEGKILRGKNKPCMEIGHMIVEPDGRLCGCGNRGCLETVASRLAISAELVLAAYRGEAPKLLEIAGTDVDGLGSSKIAAAIEHGDRVVEEIVKNGAGWLGLGIANVINLLDPDVVVLGGGLVEAMPDLFLHEVKKAIQAYCFSSFKGKQKIKVAQHGDFSAILGAAALLD